MLIVETHIRKLRKDSGRSELTTPFSVLYPRGATAELTQTVDNLDVTRPYTISLWFSLVDVDSWGTTSSCTLSVLLSDSLVFTKDYTKSDAISGPVNWKLVTTSAVIPKSPTQTIKFRYTCNSSSGWSLLDDVTFTSA